MCKAVCVIVAIGDAYEEMGKLAADSFSRFHPDVDVELITEVDPFINEVNLFKAHSWGIVKFAIAAKIASHKKAKKVIVLGADTITLSRLDEFIDNDHHDILTTLDYAYPLVQNGMILSGFENHYNADVVCFNKPKCITEVLKESIPFGKQKTIDKNANIYAEQAGLNYVCNIRQFSHFCVETESWYNVRAKTGPFRVTDGKLFSNDKQVKVWHYCFGASELTNQSIKEKYRQINKELGDEFIELVNAITGESMPFDD